jgi:DNA-binding CsgD family transcriptional regulator
MPLRPIRKGDPLTNRELEILQLRAHMSLKLIARRNRVSHHTIMAHMKNIRKKLGIGDIVRLMLEAHRRGLISY